jgi:hypothetical protein
LLLLLGIAGGIGVLGVVLVLLIPTFAGVASDAILQGGTVKVGSSPPYANGAVVRMTDDFRNSFDTGTKPELIRFWQESTGFSYNEAVRNSQRLTYDYAVIATTDTATKVNEFYVVEMDKLGFKRFLSQTNQTTSRFGFASATKREVFVVNFYQPTSSVLNIFTGKGMTLPQNRNILYLTAASF